MKDSIIQQIKVLTDQQRLLIRQLAKEQQEKNHLQFKLDPNVIEATQEGNISHFLLMDGNQLQAYMLTNFYNTTELEVTMIAVTPNQFKEFLQLAITEAQAHQLIHLLLAIDPMDHSTVVLAKDSGLTFDAAEYRLVFNGKIPISKQLELNMRPAVHADKQLIDEMDTEAFGEHGNLSLSDLLLFQLAEVNGQVIGKVRLEETRDTVGIFAFVVIPSQRGKGYGTEILTRVIQEKQQARIDYIYLEVSLDNPSALKLYEACGFEKEATFDYYQLQI